MTLACLDPPSVPADFPGAGELHIWSVDLGDPVWDAWHAVLCEQESQRYQRVLQSGARDDWRRSRIALRLLLGHYLACDAAAIAFTAGSRGKPSLDAPGLQLSFNLSHSAGAALIALARDPIGIDIERCVARGGEALLLAKIADAEREEWEDAGGAPFADTRSAFYRLWTRKEAYCKATGHGLHKAMDSFRIVTSGLAGVSMVDDFDEPAAGVSWHVHDIECVPGWAAAVCTRLTQPVMRVGRFAAPYRPGQLRSWR